MKTKQKRVEPVITPGRIVTKVITFRGKQLTINLHMNNYTYPEFSFELIDKVTNETGNELIGVWKWGTYGQLHHERLEFDTRKDTTGYLNMYTERSWCNGRQKNGRKYLIDIIVKPAN